MSDYDFHQLSPLEFERLGRDLIQAEKGITLESFKEGRDGGIDFRYAQGSENTIVQCKHTVRGGLNSLLSLLRKEAPKVTKLAPTRYLLITSVPLSPANKTTIQKIIGDRYLAQADIWGQDQLNNLLLRHVAVERSHFKLWLASTAVLDRILHNEVVTQTDFEVRKAYSNILKYVQSSAYPQALDMLEKERVVVISGSPGVGKSPLANALLYRHLERGYLPVVVKRDIGEGQKLFQFGKPQIFHYDDFMGATFLGDRNSPLDRNGDRSILDFVEMVKETPHSRIILTTREHIFSQALAGSERLRQSDLNLRKVVVTVGQYSKRQKAEILYNHIYFSDLPDEYRAALLGKDFYLQILKHPKFNPRLIEWLSSYQRVKANAVENYQDFIKRLLDNPSEIWMHAYREQLSEAGRSMLLALYSYDGKISQDLLRRAFESLHRSRAKRYNFSIKPEHHADAIAELANAFVRPTQHGGVEVIDPSVMDLMNSVMLAAPQNAVDLVLAMGNPTQLERIWKVATSIGKTSVLPELGEAMSEIAPNLEATLLANRRLRHDDAIFSFSLSYEKRLNLVLSIYQETSSAALQPIIQRLLERMKQEWLEDGVDISDATALVQVLPKLRRLPDDTKDEIRNAVRVALVSYLQQAGARPEELRAVFMAFGNDAAMNDALVQSYGYYRHNYFADDLDQARSKQEYESLIEDLTFLQSMIGVDAEGPIDAAQTSLNELEENEDAYADAHQDDWKDELQAERASDNDIREMFGSLKGS
ncbi:nSTAND3 domain-containing NTPase [Rhizobium laguerreae]|uniref:nSTAND3 domain-containing NTPase n=1 Tax=Rhizobium laguerreae TaxID=1076926 RepID=UPI001C915948|nr:restriction endonuclease [Rhizobium laguerreae]